METAFGDGTCARQLLPSQWRQLAAPLSGALAQSFLGRYPHPLPDSQAPPCEGPYVPFHTPDPAEALQASAPTARSMDNPHRSPRLPHHRSADLEILQDYHDQSSTSLTRAHCMNQTTHHEDFTIVKEIGPHDRMDRCQKARLLPLLTLWRCPQRTPPRGVAHPQTVRVLPCLGAGACAPRSQYKS